MDEGKILIVNLSKGLIGEDNAAILGSFLVTKIQLAAMSRSDILDIGQRRPFYLYVDEFQNFATDSFATIMSEARKYGLNLTVANQYISQMDATVRDAVFGNVGTMISFRVSADDAPILAKQFEPNFAVTDLLQMNNRHFIINMVIGGEKTPAFAAQTLELPAMQTDNTQLIVEHTRQYHTRERQQIEQEIAAMMQPVAPSREQLWASAIAPPRPATTQGNIARTATVATEAAARVIELPKRETETSTRKRRSRSRRRKSSNAATSAVESPRANDHDTAMPARGEVTEIGFKIEH